MAAHPVTSYVPEENVRTFESNDLPMAFHDRMHEIVNHRLRTESLRELNMGDMYLMAYVSALEGIAQVHKHGSTYYITFPSREAYVAWLLTL